MIDCVCYFLIVDISAPSDISSRFWFQAPFSIYWLPEMDFRPWEFTFLAWQEQAPPTFFLLPALSSEHFPPNLQLQQPFTWEEIVPQREAQFFGVISMQRVGDWPHVSRNLYHGEMNKLMPSSPQSQFRIGLCQHATFAKMRSLLRPPILFAYTNCSSNDIGFDLGFAITFHGYWYVKRVSCYGYICCFNSCCCCCYLHYSAE